MNNIRKKLSIILIIFFILVDGNTAIKDSLFATVGNKAIARSDIITEIKIILILSNQSYDEEKLIADSEKIAYNMIKWYLVKQKIQISEDIKISKNDLDNNIKDIIKKNQTQKKEIKEYYDKDENKKQLYNTMLDEKLFICLNDYFLNQIKEKSTDYLRKNKGKK